MTVHLPNVVHSKVVLVVTVVFLENCCDLLLRFVSEGLRVHWFHKFYEANASGFLGIELCDYFIGGLSVGFKTVLGQQELEIIG